MNQVVFTASGQSYVCTRPPKNDNGSMSVFYMLDGEETEIILPSTGGDPWTEVVLVAK